MLKTCLPINQKIKRLFTIHYSLFTDRTGFTLIEIAIVLIIMGLLLTVGMQLMGPITKRVKRTESREIVKAAKESVLGFAVKNKRLPTTAEFAAQVKNTDAWTKTLFYYPDSNLTTGNACYSSSTGFQIEDECPTGDSCATSHSCCKTGSSFILLSTGEDGTNSTGTAPIFTILEQGDTLAIRQSGSR